MGDWSRAEIIALASLIATLAVGGLGAIAAWLVVPESRILVRALRKRAAAASLRGWPRAPKVALIGLVLIALACLTRSATPTRALEPVTVVVDWSKDEWRETVDAHRPVTAQWRWLVCQPQVLQDDLDVLTFEVKIDGLPTDSRNIAPRYEGVRKEHLYDRHWWVHYWSYPIGAFESGSTHWVEVECHLSRDAASGCDLDGDGHDDMDEASSPHVTRLVLTVQ